jgi:hypothetical protein
MWQIPDAVDKVVWAPDDGWIYHPKYVEQFPDKINCVTLHLVGYMWFMTSTLMKGLQEVANFRFSNGVCVKRQSNEMRLLFMDYVLKEAIERKSKQALHKLRTAYIINSIKHRPSWNPPKRHFVSRGVQKIITWAEYLKCRIKCIS